MQVSVPSRGTTFPNKRQKHLRVLPTEFPSPLGELHFQIRDGSVFDTEIDPFPSPLGELHFQIINGLLFCAHPDIEFPSPLGELHFQIEHAELDAAFLEFPSPLGELHFQINNNQTRQSAVQRCFRPLSGNYISKW